MNIKHQRGIEFQKSKQQRAVNSFFTHHTSADWDVAGFAVLVWHV